MTDAEVLEVVRQRGRRITLTDKAKLQRIQRGVSEDDIREVLVAAKALRPELDGWRILGGETRQGLPLEPLVAANAGGILVLEL